MKAKKITAAASALAILASCAVVSPVIAEDKLAAFPGAEGGGMYSTGAREKQSEVYHVTSLADDGKGTLRDAVSKSDRIIVFDVAGNIELKNALNINGSNLTILGQTAPGDGICIKDHTVMVNGSNVILRYLRFRMGDEATVEDDSIGGRSLNNVIIDHCSMSWSTDECVSFYENSNFTMQWCIVSESLKQSVHAKGSHGYGGIWGGKNASFHHNLIADHDSRNPRIATAGIDAAYNDVTKQTDLTDLRNNVVYNWGGNSAYGGENGAPVNIVNCYYVPGPATKHKERIYQISAKKEGDNTGTNSLNRPGWGTDLYVQGNIVKGSTSVSNDNTKGVDLDSNTTKYGLWTDANITDDEKSVHNRYAADYPINTQTAEDAYNSVLEKAGANISRDSVDKRIINDVKNGTSEFGADGIINSQTEVGGYPVLTGTKAKDSDNDGIPNEWEDKNGLNKFDKTDGLKTAPSGYMYVEEYANALADGSYIRDTEYDPNVEDYIPEDDPTETNKPDADRKKELVSEWNADSSDKGKTAGTELMPGLVTMFNITKVRSDSITFADGMRNCAVTSDETGGWANGKSKGTSLEFTAPCDGIFTLYAYTVSGTKTFYVVPKGAASNTECIYSQEYTGASIPVLYNCDMKQGDTYYFYIDGSKMRFCGAKYEKYVDEIQMTPTPTLTPTTAPTEVPKNRTYEIVSVSNDGTSVDIKKNAASEGDSTAIVGYYNNGVLVAVKTIKINQPVNEVKQYETGRTLESGENVKVFVWNDLNSMEPLSGI